MVIKKNLLLFSMVTILALLLSYQAVAVNNSSFRCKDLNYHYSLSWLGMVSDYSSLVDQKDQTESVASKKILIEVSIESIYGGFEWLPLNPHISDNLGQVYHDYKVIVEPISGASNLSIKYLISPLGPNTKTISLYETGDSDDGKKSYRISLKNLPLSK